VITRDFRRARARSRRGWNLRRDELHRGTANAGDWHPDRARRETGRRAQDDGETSTETRRAWAAYRAAECIHPHPRDVEPALRDQRDRSDNVRQYLACPDGRGDVGELHPGVTRDEGRSDGRVAHAVKFDGNQPVGRSAEIQSSPHRLYRHHSNVNLNYLWAFAGGIGFV